MSDRDLTTPRRQVFGTVEKGTKCRVCGRNVTDGRAVYCSDYCRNIAEGVMTLLNWSGVRRLVKKRDDYTCQECGLKEAWIDDGNSHIHDIIHSKLPERPRGPALSEVDDWDQNDMREHLDEANEWDEQKEELKDRYGDPWDREIRLEVDHIKPVADGGHPFDPANLRTLCSDCHQEKTSDENSERGGRGARPDVERELFDYVSDG